ncbi:hypothetical protein H6F90_12350 [Trichocoleus sp. FACHB-591]|uniref:hypothetical protein n=1 Tax=Trichocoleus sp. FACHB-591 TaxID=2692872 RepID=UPI0016873EFA|nr:hypothetical protein [Trichocoleus sp. FACHB-591]MBD2095939.1 hypothetical protein [Trichocoleus sp. FACHB-591]
MNDSKELFDYWHDRVRLRNQKLMEAPGHLKTPELRHECTNYDELRQGREVQLLGEPERSKVIAIIKYECTAQALQYRAGCLRDRANKLEDACNELDREKSRLLKFVKALQEKLFGKDKELEQLKARIARLEAENETLRMEVEKAEAYAELQVEFEKLQKQYAVIEKRRKELAKNNQSLGGRVAGVQRVRQARDAAQALAKEQKQQITTLTKENQRLRKGNEKLQAELEKLQKRNDLGRTETQDNETR